MGKDDLPPSRQNERINSVWKEVRIENREAYSFPNELIARKKKFQSLQITHVFKELWKETRQGIVLLQILQVCDL